MQSTLRKRLLAANVSTAALALTAGNYTMATLVAALSLTEAQLRERIVSTGQAIEGGTRSGNVVELTGIGTGAANGTVSVRVWQIKRGFVSDSTTGIRRLAADFELAILYTFVFTLGTCIGAVGGELVLVGERVGDGVAVTTHTSASSPAGIADVIESIYGAANAAAMSTTGDKPGRGLFADTGNADVFLEIACSAGDCNCIVEVNA